MIENIPFRLLKVPPFHHELTVKASLSGITVLNDGRFKKRYVGSKQSGVDINGKLYLKRAEMVALIQADNKKSGSLTRRTANSSKNANDESMQKTIERKKSYRVHKTEVRSRLLTMINTGRGKKELYFWTVTFPLGTSDMVAYRLFNTWLTTLRQKKWLRNYLWIAERQKNGTVHFHVAIPHQLSIVAANNAMRTILKTSARKKEIEFSVFQCRRYNGIDIAKNRTTRRVTNFAVKKGSRSLANYLTKYVTKNDTKFSHLAWHNSRGFSALFTGVTFTVSEFLGYGFRQIISQRAVITNEYFRFYAWKDEPPDAITKHLFELNSFIQSQTEPVPVPELN